MECRWSPHYDQKTGETKFERSINIELRTTSNLVPDFDGVPLARTYHLEFRCRYESEPKEPWLEALRRKLGLGSIQIYIRDSNDDNNIDHPNNRIKKETQNFSIRWLLFTS